MGDINVRVQRAHNDWVDLIVQGGLVGLLMLVVPAGWLCWRGWATRSALNRWALSGCALIAVYALADMPFHNPAVLLLWGALVTSAAPLRSRPSSLANAPRG
jgi:O-antigen ligase